MKTTFKNFPFFFIAFFLFLFLTSCKKEINKDKDNTPALKIGDEHAGGLIFYIDSTGLHGLVSAKSGLALEGEWGCSGDSIIGTKTALGTGQANTQIILSACSTPGIGARLADDLVYNGFSDWFLPSKDELSLMYIHRDVLQFLSGDIRFSSSQIDRNYAWGQAFITLPPSSLTKSIVRRIRAVRAF